MMLKSVTGMASGSPAGAAVEAAGGASSRAMRAVSISFTKISRPSS